MLGIVVGALVLGCSGCMGVFLSKIMSRRITGFEDGPPRGRPPAAWLVLACVLIGGFLMTRGMAPALFAAVSLIGLALVACWCSDMMCGVIPDAFTLVPLGGILLVALWQHHWSLILSAAIPFIPFAAAAAISHGYGMGWGDVKLAALGGAVLGARTALLAFAIACLAAVLVNRITGTRRRPIAFAPYLAAAIGLGIPIGALL